MMHRRDFIATAGAAALARPALAQGAATRTLRFVPETGLTILDPIVTTAAVTTTHGYCVFDTLFGVDERLRPQPQMAAGATASDDGKTYDVVLRDGLRFHDGTPVLARDCAASLRRWGARDSFGQAVAAVVDAWEARDDRTLRVRLKHPFPQLLRALGKPHSSPAFIMPERIADTSPTAIVTEMVGSGPFRFVADEFVSGSRMVYAKFDGYVPRSEPASWSAGGKRVHFDRVVWTVMPDASVAASALQAGEVDWVESVIGDLLPTLRRDAAVTLRHLDPFGLILGMRFNHLTKPFDDVALRRAVMSAVSQAEYMQAVAGDVPGNSRRCLAMFPCGLPGVSELGAEAMRQPPDLARAKEAVAAAGHGGEKVVMLAAADHPVIAPLGEVTADLLKRIGLDVDVQTMDWGTVVQRRTSKAPVDRGGWSIFHTTWPGSSVTNPAENLYIRGAGEKGWFGWHDSPGMEALTAEWLAAPEEAQQRRLLDQIQLSAFATVPIVPLGQVFPTTAYRSGIKDVLTASAPFFWNVRPA